MAKKKTLTTKKEQEPKKVGRPTDYRPEYCQLMIEFFNVALYKAEKGTAGWRANDNKKELNNFPTFQEFSFKVGVVMETLHLWAKAHTEFMAAYKQCKAIQERLLVNGGLSRAYDSTFAKFILNSVSDTFKEKVEHSLDLDTKNVIKLAYALPKKEID